MVVEACRIVTELYIPEEAQLEAKIQRLAMGVHEAKEEVARVQFKLNMKIMELELKSQPLTLPNSRNNTKLPSRKG